MSKSLLMAYCRDNGHVVGDSTVTDYNITEALFQNRVEAGSVMMTM